ncbi:ceramide kinase [Phlebotomus papatasi]|uniref:ceramide kinase n=1 Tax=Phlebotomus papatasi TaxID=29031 RepID=UPI00248455E8|nr:ceramide kinase [Phlebotomus papatasi]
MAEAQDVVLLAAFQVDRKRVRAILHGGHVAWEPCKAGRQNRRHQVPLTDVVNVTVNSATLTLHYGTRGRSDHQWRLQRTSFVATDVAVVDLWRTEIQRQIKLQDYRPKYLLIFVNPFGGRRTAGRIFERRVKPLLELAEIRYELIVTERPQHISDTIENHDLEPYDGAACVGGDGTFAELFNGLVARECRHKDIPMSNGDLPRPQLPLAVIPGGSTNTVAFCLHGTDDVTTCAIHMILGLRTGFDLCSVRSGDGQVRLYASVLSYGYLGDIARESEQLRWMGPRRYDYSGVRKFLRNRGYRGEVSVLLDTTDPTATSPKCLEHCDRCSAPDDTNDTTETPWQVIRGKFLMVNGANISCACRRSPAGMSPGCHLGDGCVDVIVVHHTHLLNNLRLLLKLSSRSGSVAELPFVRVLRARSFHFRPADTSADAPPTGSTQPIACDNGRRSVWNCDGEVLLEGDTTVRVHRKLLTVFRRPLADTNTQGCALCNN